MLVRDRDNPIESEPKNYEAQLSINPMLKDIEKKTRKKKVKPSKSTNKSTCQTCEPINALYKI
jgi:hypothetical protein